MRRHRSRKVVNNPLSVLSCRRKPCLILKDVLKTEEGKTYLERIKQSHMLGNRGKVTSTQRESGRCREEPLICRETRSSQREANNDMNKSLTPKRNQRTTSPPSPRWVDPVKRIVQCFWKSFGANTSSYVSDKHKTEIDPPVSLKRKHTLREGVGLIVNIIWVWWLTGSV